jgi:hypothetical protein
LHGSNKQLAGRGYTLYVVVDLAELALGQRAPSRAFPTSVEKLGDFIDRETHLLKQRNDREALNHGLVVKATATRSTCWCD